MTDPRIEWVARAIVGQITMNKQGAESLARITIAALDAARGFSVPEDELRKGCVERLSLPVGRVRAVKYARSVRPWDLKEAVEYVNKLDAERLLLDAARGDGWITSKPTRGQSGLAYIEYFDRGVPTHEMIVFRMDDDVALLAENGDDLGWNVEVVVAWRPLPAPPKGAGQ